MMRAAKPRSRFPLSEREKVQSRLESAVINSGAALVEPRGNDRYVVQGRSGRYTVHAFGLESFYCDCKAGRYHNACFHAACVYLWLVSKTASAA